MCQVCKSLNPRSEGVDGKNKKHEGHAGMLKREAEVGIISKVSFKKSYIYVKH